MSRRDSQTVSCTKRPGSGQWSCGGCCERHQSGFQAPTLNRTAIFKDTSICVRGHYFETGTRCRECDVGRERQAKRPGRGGGGAREGHGLGTPRRRAA